MSFVVSCRCGKQFKVRDEQAGKKAKCPGCGTPLLLQPSPPPRAQEESDPFASFDLEAAAAMERDAVVDESAPPVAAPPRFAPPRGGGDAGPKLKPCPSCGSMISTFAMRCEHCGASFAGGGTAARPARAAGGGQPNVGLGIASMILGILSIVSFCFWPISGLLSLVAILLGSLARGGGMAKAGIITAIVGIVFNVGFIVVAVSFRDELEQKVREAEQQQQMQRQSP